MVRSASPVSGDASTAAQGEEPLLVPAMGGSLPDYVFTKTLGLPAFGVRPVLDVGFLTSARRLALRPWYIVPYGLEDRACRYTGDGC